MKSSAQAKRLEQRLPFAPPFKMPKIIGEAPAMQEVFRAIGGWRNLPSRC